MMDTARKKRVAAAIAAVTAYLQYEQEAGMAAEAPKAMTAPAAPVRLWGISGRQAQMQNRTLMQMRAF